MDHLALMLRCFAQRCGWLETGMAVRVKVSKKHPIAVPSSVRKQLGIKSGDALLVEVRDGYAVLLPEPQDYSQLCVGCTARSGRMSCPRSMCTRSVRRGRPSCRPPTARAHWG